MDLQIALTDSGIAIEDGNARELLNPSAREN